MKYLAVFTIFYLCTVFAEDQAGIENDGDLKTVTKLIMDCTSKQDTFVCFKMKAVKFLDRLVKTPTDVALTDFVTLSRVNTTVEGESTDLLTEEELEASLPRQMDEKNNRLDTVLWEKLQELFNTRTLTLHSPREEGDSARGKGKGDKGYKGKGMVMIMGGMMMKAMMMGVTMMSAKAMMMAKAALILAGIVALKKLGGGGGDHPQVVYASSEHAPAVPSHPEPSGWQRRRGDANFLAYGRNINE